MAYSLTAVQEAAFVQLFELWRPVRRRPRAGLAKTLDGVYYELAYDDVPGRVEQKTEVSTPTVVGRTNYDIVVTMDVIRLHIEQEVDDTWFVREKAEGQWYSIQGGPQQRVFRGETALFMAKRAAKPPEEDDLPG